MLLASSTLHDAGASSVAFIVYLAAVMLGILTPRTSKFLLSSMERGVRGQGLAGNAAHNRDHSTTSAKTATQISTNRPPHHRFARVS
jgi:hypothetical protein